MTPSMFNPYSNSYNGGGWVASLEAIVRTDSSINLGVAFHFDDNQFCYSHSGVTYYPIPRQRAGMLGMWNRTKAIEALISYYLRIINDFKPDLIQIFGSENDFGLMCGKTDIPIVIHMQGCIPPYHNALFPVGMTKYDFLFHRGLNWRNRIMGWRSEQAFRKRAEKEIETIKSCCYFMGRTDWDKRLIDLFHPQAHYFHCEEALRDSFLKGNRIWRFNESERKTIVCVISRPWYKGCDLILKTAQLLKRFTDLDFEWRVYGVPDLCFFENKYGIKASKVSVQAMGTASKDKLVAAICDAACYVHPSYIENSPNSLCEAQILGAPVLATHVGGISSLIKDGENGILFPANAPYTLASLIKRVVTDRIMAEKLGGSARTYALKRHNPKNILNTIKHIYQFILDENRS